MPDPISAQVMIVEDDALLAIDLATSAPRPSGDRPVLLRRAACEPLRSINPMLPSSISISTGKCRFRWPMRWPAMCPSCG